MQVQVKRAFKSYFYYQKKQTGSARNFLQPPIQVRRGAYIPISQFYCPFFLKKYLNPQVRTNKMAEEHNVNYHPSPSEITSRIHL